MQTFRTAESRRATLYQRQQPRRVHGSRLRVRLPRTREFSVILASGPAKMDQAFNRDFDKVHEQSFSRRRRARQLLGSKEAGPIMRSAETEQDRRSPVTSITCAPSSRA